MGGLGLVLLPPLPEKGGWILPTHPVHSFLEVMRILKQGQCGKDNLTHIDPAANPMNTWNANSVFKRGDHPTIPGRATTK